MRIRTWKNNFGLHFEIKFKSGKLVEFTFNKFGVHFEKGRWEF